MIWPFLLFGALAFWLGRSSSAPVIGALGSGAAARTIKRVGERVQFEFGVPYQIVATTEALSGSERGRLYSLLTFGTYHGRNVSFASVRPGVTSVSLCFVAPKTSVVPIGQPLDWDLGDGRLRLVLREVRRLDGKDC